MDEGTDEVCLKDMGLSVWVTMEDMDADSYTFVLQLNDNAGDVSDEP